MKTIRLFATLLAALAMVACGDKEPVDGPNTPSGGSTKLSAPTGLAVVEGTLTTTAATIEWGAVEGAVGYKYVLQKGAKQIKNEQVVATSVSFTDLEKATDYLIYLYAVA